MNIVVCEYCCLNTVCANIFMVFPSSASLEPGTSADPFFPFVPGPVLPLPDPHPSGKGASRQTFSTPSSLHAHTHTHIHAYRPTLPPLRAHARTHTYIQLHIQICLPTLFSLSHMQTLASSSHRSLDGQRPTASVWTILGWLD